MPVASATSSTRQQAGTRHDPSGCRVGAGSGRSSSSRIGLRYAEDADHVVGALPDDGEAGVAGVQQVHHPVRRILRVQGDHVDAGRHHLPRGQRPKVQAPIQQRRGGLVQVAAGAGIGDDPQQVIRRRPRRQFLHRLDTDQRGAAGLPRCRTAGSAARPPRVVGWPRRPPRRSRRGGSRCASRGRVATLRWHVDDPDDDRHRGRGSAIRGSSTPGVSDELWRRRRRVGRLPAISTGLTVSGSGGVDYAEDTVYNGAPDIVALEYGAAARR